MTFLAGLLAGLVGIGGGMVLGPLLLEIGMIPQVSSVSAALMVCFAASAAAVQYLMLGVYPLGYTLLYGSVAGLGAWVSCTTAQQHNSRTATTAITATTAHNSTQQP
jgi:uncharacterized membrane protein YfcA